MEEMFISVLKMSYFIKYHNLALSLSLSLSLFLSQVGVYQLGVISTAPAFPYRKNPESSNKSKVKPSKMWHTVLGQSCFIE